MFSSFQKKFSRSVSYALVNSEISLSNADSQCNVLGPERAADICLRDPRSSPIRKINRTPIELAQLVGRVSWKNLYYRVIFFVFIGANNIFRLVPGPEESRCGPSSGHPGVTRSPLSQLPLPAVDGDCWDTLTRPFAHSIIFLLLFFFFFFLRRLAVLGRQPADRVPRSDPGNLSAGSPMT